MPRSLSLNIKNFRDAVGRTVLLGIAIPDEHSPFWKDCRRKILGGKIIKIVEDDPHGKKIILKNHVNNEESTVEFNDIHCALKW